MPQFFINPDLIKDGLATVSGGDARHITTVLRLKKGNWIVLVDGKGNRFRAEIISASPKEVKARLTTELSQLQMTGPITLAQAVLKHDRFEEIVQKAVELGCSEIIPFMSERTVPVYQGASNKHKRWQKIADEAAKQCGTIIHPIIRQVASFLELLRHAGQYKTKIIFYEGESVNNLETHKLTNSETLIIIGPEGGFSSQEVEAAKKAGVVTCGLGPLILRAPTAAIAALTLVQQKLGYFYANPWTQGGKKICPGKFDPGI